MNASTLTLTLNPSTASGLGSAGQISASADQQQQQQQQQQQTSQLTQPPQFNRVSSMGSLGDIKLTLKDTSSVTDSALQVLDYYYQFK